MLHPQLHCRIAALGLATFARWHSPFFPTARRLLDERSAVLLDSTGVSSRYHLRSKLTRTLYMSVPLCRRGAIVTVLQSVKSPSTAVLESAKRLIDRVLSAGWVSYLLIAALQLKVIWAIWRLRDLTYGDESRYFLSAYQWANELLTNPIWSPLYTAYYGTIYWLLGEDVYAAA